MRAPVTIGPLARRAALLVAGSVIATSCYAVTIRADIGLGPLFVLQAGVAKHAGIAIGTSVTVVGLALVVLALALRSAIGPGTLILPVLGGVTLDALLPHLPTIHGWPLRTVSVVVATWVMALGAVMTIRASVGINAYDAVMLGLHRVLRRPLTPIRLAMEATVLLAGWLLGGPVGLGTVITGVLIGPGIQFWLRLTGTPVRLPARAAPAVATTT